MNDHLEKDYIDDDFKNKYNREIIKSKILNNIFKQEINQDII